MKDNEKFPKYIDVERVLAEHRADGMSGKRMCVCGQKFTWLSEHRAHIAAAILALMEKGEKGQ